MRNTWEIPFARRGVSSFFSGYFKKLIFVIGINF
jgi:hypothetical protein